MNLPVKLEEDKKLQQKNVAINLVRSLTENEKSNLKNFCQSLIDIKNNEKSNINKIQEILKITGKRKIIFPVLKSIYKSIKKYAWEDRGIKSRLGILGLGIGATFFAGQSAGIAALGSAIGVPLWIVFGAGGAFAGFILEEIERNTHSSKDVVDATYVDITSENKKND